MTQPSPIPSSSGLDRASGGAVKSLHGFLGRDFKSASLHCKYSQELSHSFAREASLAHSSVNSNQSFLTGKSSGDRRGGFVYDFKGSNQGSFSGLPLFRFEHFHSAQKGWGKPSDYQSEAPQQSVPFSPSLQDGHGERRGLSPSGRRLRGFNRSERCILSHPYPPISKEIPSFCLERQAVRVPGSAFRPLYSSVYFHKSDSPSRRLSPLPWHSGDFLPGRHFDSGEVSSGVSPFRPISPASSPAGGVSDKLEEIFSNPVSEVSVPRPLVGLSHTKGFSRRQEARLSPISSVSSPFSDISDVSFGDEAAGSHDSCHASSAPHQAALQTPSDMSQQVLQDIFGSSPSSHSDPGSEGRGAMGDQFSNEPVPGSNLAPLFGGHGSQSSIGCIGQRLGPVLRGSNGERQLGCSCPSPYQCQGDHDSLNLPPGLLAVYPSSSQVHSVGDRLHNSSSLHSKGGGDSLPSSPRGGAGNSSFGKETTSLNNSCVCAIGGESSCRFCFQIQESSRPPSAPVGVSQDLLQMGQSGDRPVCVSPVCSSSPVHGLGQCRVGSSIRRPLSTMVLRSGLCFPPNPSDPQSDTETSPSNRRLHIDNPVLDSPGLVPQVNQPASEGPPSSPLPRQSSGGPDNRPAAGAPTLPPSRRLEDYRRAHNLGSVSDDAFNLISNGWRKSSNDRYERAWEAFSRFLRSHNVPVDSVSIGNVVDYLSLLYRKNLSYSTINLHRSAISMTLPLLNALPIGQHPLVTRLMKGVHNKRPPTRRLFPSWNAGSVIQMFKDWSSPHSLHNQIRKTAFLLAMASTRRPSELASLKVSETFLSINPTSARFVPSLLSKTDKAGRMGKPISVYRLSADPFICPVSNVELLLQLRQGLDISHDFLFHEDKSPFQPLSVAAFSRRISWVLDRAGIAAPPGSTRAMSTSSAFSKGLDLDAILRAGNWAGADVFFRFYCRDLGVTPQGPPASLDE